jgi:death-on-curing protein
MDLNPKFLTLEQVLDLHNQLIDKFGGSHGIKDEGLLISPLAQPESYFENNYLHKDIFEMAAAYLFHLVKNHAFYDGNKRIAALTAAVFLEVNGYEIIANEEDFEKLVLDVAQSLVTKEKIAEFFRKNTTKL